MTETFASSTPKRVITAAACRRSAAWFNYGNLIAVSIPMPMMVLWFGASIALYTMMRHHPNERVGHYTQWAAYRFYGLLGIVVVVGTFYANSLYAWLVTWGVVATIMIPWTLYDLYLIHKKETWIDTIIEETEE